MAQSSIGTNPDRDSGRGRAALGGSIEEIRPGDVTIRAGEKHWHGVAPTTAMTPSPSRNIFGRLRLMEHVSDEQYQVDVAQGSSKL
jgi:hypothetical protein